MKLDIDAIAFDIDGTLYPNWAFWRLLGPFLLRNARMLAEFGKVREDIRDWQEAHPGEVHPDEASDDFFSWQAALLAPKIGMTPDEARKAIDEKIYRGWVPLFEKVKPYPYLHESFESFRAAGLKIGLMSDFLPSQKGDVWGLAPRCDVVLGSEETGALKPSPIPFHALASALGVPESRILYVGNSLRSDVRGARAVGMKTACIVGPLAGRFSRKAREADIFFSSYRQLAGFVLE